MAFFRNRAVNLLNLHYGIHAIAMGGGGAFFLVFLLKSGVPAPGVFLSIASAMLLRFVIRPAIIPLAVRTGLRTMIALGTLLSAAQYPLLAEVHGVGPLLYALIAVAALGDTVYWSSYHAYFAALGDDEHRGQQIGAREAIAAVIGIASPLAAGWLLVTFGSRLAFGLTAFIVVIAAVPFIWTPKVKVAPRAPGALKASLPGVAMFMADGWVAAGFVFAWQITLFLSLGENLLAFGGALALAALVGAVGGMVLGRHIDAGHGRRAVAVAFAVIAFVIAVRAAAIGDAAAAVVANALGSLASCLYMPALMTAVYTQAKRSPCPLRFHVMTEGGWDVGGSCGLLIAALMAWLGLPLWTWTLSALLGVAAGFVMLRRYYARNPGVAIDIGTATAPELETTAPR
jgi:DHA1 family inner membrane transport protein